MKTVWFVAHATPVGSPDRAEHDIFGVVLGVFWQIRVVFVVGGPLFDVGIPY